MAGAEPVRVRQLDQHQQPRGALHQGAHCTGIERPLDQVILPVAGELPVFNLGWAHMDAQQINDLAAAILALGARPAFEACHAQAGNEFFAQFSCGLGVNDVLDGFV
jgi:hypothetical protein